MRICVKNEAVGLRYHKVEKAAATTAVFQGPLASTVSYRKANWECLMFCCGSYGSGEQAAVSCELIVEWGELCWGSG